VAQKPNQTHAVKFVHRKDARTHYDELVFLHPVGSMGQVLQSGASGRETSKHYFSCSGGTGTYSAKSALGHVMPNLLFCILWDLRVM
jgi:hypothetical protein